MEPIDDPSLDTSGKASLLEEDIFDLESRLEAKDQEIDDLAQIASVITSILDIESVLAITMETSLRQVAGEVGAILLAEGSEFKVKIAWGIDADGLDKLTYKDGRSLVRYCFETRETVLEGHDQRLESAAYSIHSLIAAPILTQSRALGVIVVFNKEEDGEFSPQDRRTLEMIGSFAAVAIENSRLLRESVDKQKMEQELELACQVQTTLLPESFGVRGLRVVSTYLPAGHVGGDYYDIIPITDRQVLFLLGDVTNKGVPAALVMTAAYSIIHAYVGSGRAIDIQSLMSHLNEVLCGHIIKSRDMFITLFMAFVDIDKGEIEYSNGGHPPAFF
ncbi:MAG: SpoIIE family protein phosphatase, partial [candidate division Zixibacteria bacterium]|nr:SpoIIE family protein phosphatase [candidate division Zixibacteria bacterium]